MDQTDRLVDREDVIRLGNRLEELSADMEEQPEAEIPGWMAYDIRRILDTWNVIKAKAKTRLTSGR